MAFKCDQMDEIDATATIVKQIAEESKNHITVKILGILFFRFSLSN
jgi:hypothetical protein